MSGKFTKINHQLGQYKFPMTFSELEKASLELPKTVRQFRLNSLKAMRKHIKKDEKIYFMTMGSPKMLKGDGFIAVAENNLVITYGKNSLMGGAEAIAIKYKDIRFLDFDILPFDTKWGEAGILTLRLKGFMTDKKQTIREIPQEDIHHLVNLIKMKMGVIDGIEIEFEEEGFEFAEDTQSSSNADELKKLADLQKDGVITKKEFQAEKKRILKNNS